jgi:hypothetical protein
MCGPFRGFAFFVLPSEAAVVRSVGVLTKKTGDLADGDGVRRRKV